MSALCFTAGCGECAAIPILQWRITPWWWPPAKSLRNTKYLYHALYHCNVSLIHFSGTALTCWGWGAFCNGNRLTASPSPWFFGGRISEKTMQCSIKMFLFTYVGLFILTSNWIPCTQDVVMLADLHSWLSQSFQSVTEVTHLPPMPFFLPVPLRTPRSFNTSLALQAPFLLINRYRLCLLI